MKFAYAVLVILVMFVAGVFAQDAPKNTIAVSGVYGRTDVNLKDIRGESFSLDASRDAVGFEATWHYAPTKGPFMIGMTGGVLFHNKDTAGVYSCGTGCVVETRGISKVQKGYFQYEMGFADRKGNFQPGIAGVVGVNRGNFGGVTFVPGGRFVAEGGTQFYYGAKTWFDINVSKKKVFLRPGLQVTQGFNGDTTKVDVQPSIGLAFKF